LDASFYNYTHSSSPSNHGHHVRHILTFSQGSIYEVKLAFIILKRNDVMKKITKMKNRRKPKKSEEKRTKAKKNEETLSFVALLSFV
jgi:hypothetical protein